jgi:RNA polymerase sigma-70 factor (ECF subfamily)
LSAWDTHEQELRAFLLARIADPHDADDVLQELFVKLVLQGHAFCEVQNPRAWLFRVLRNFLTDRYRTAKTFVDVDSGMPDMPLERDEKPPIVQLETCLIRNLAHLSDDDRNIIEQCDLHGQPQQHYADQYGLTLTAVKSRLLRARQRLRKEIVVNCQVRFDKNGQVCCHVPR